MGDVRVKREAFYVDVEGAALFAWLHEPALQAPFNDTVAVLCPPLGHEYVHSHRTWRHLADTLARQGIPALRYDHRGTGNASGDEHDSGLFEAWVSDLGALIAQAKARTGRTRVCLLGLRMGASLAALLAARVSVDTLVLWSPCLKGSQYLRELKAVALAKGHAGRDADGLFESSGFLFSQETEVGISQLNLLSAPRPQARHVVVVKRDDLVQKVSYSEHLRAQGLAVTTLMASGYADMMSAVHDNVIPVAALEAIAQTVCELAGAPQGVAAPEGAGATPHAPWSTEVLSADCLQRESVQTIPHGEGLFAVLTEPVGPARGAHPPVLVLFNAGAVHHVGPGRLYVTMARTLVGEGLTVLRCDLSGLGDSIAPDPSQEGNPYPPQALSDAQGVLQWVHARYPDRPLVLGGLCAGAYTAFKLAVQTALPLAHLLLINPLTFDWQPGMSLNVDEYEMMMRQEAASDGGGAVGLVGTVLHKLKAGELSLRQVGHLAAWRGAKTLRGLKNALLEACVPAMASRLSQDLQVLARAGTPITLVVSSSDPGWVIMQDQAKRAANAAVRRGQLHVMPIEDADHTFTQGAARLRLLTQLRQWARQWA